MNRKPPPERQMMVGVVTARPCACCGHHEIGVVTADGAYLPLRPGMRIGIMDRPDPDRSSTTANASLPKDREADGR